MYHDSQYIELLQKLLHQPENHRDDRTGTGTISTFSEQITFDVSEHFPLLTSKKVYFKGLAHELLWVISGDTQLKYLNDNDVHIWDEWATPLGQLGPVYGEMLRAFPAPSGYTLVDIKKIEDHTILLENDKSVFGVGTYGVYDVAVVSDDDIALKNLWLSIMSKCYNQKDLNFSDVGDYGVIMCNRWLDASLFIHDVKKLPQYILYKRDPTLYTLSNYYFNKHNMYHPDTCVWIHQKHNTPTDLLVPIQLHNKGYIHYFNTIKSCSEFLDTNVITVEHHLNTGEELRGYNISHFQSDTKLIRPFLATDQLQRTVDLINTTTQSRRILTSYWHPSLAPPELTDPTHNAISNLQALPPCHYSTQFYVDGDDLSLKFIMRSTDVFLGLPFNIAQYALMLYMMAQVTNKKPKNVIWSGGDVHLYINHIKQATIQANRPLLESPTLQLNPVVKHMEDFTYSDFKIQNYNPHAGIKAPIAI